MKWFYFSLLAALLGTLFPVPLFLSWGPNMSQKHTTLRDRIADRVELTDAEKLSFVEMIGKGCRQPTKAQLHRMVQLPISLWANYGIYSRVWFGEYKPEECTYCCGQSWSDEMRTLRECLLK